MRHTLMRFHCLLMSRILMEFCCLPVLYFRMDSSFLLLTHFLMILYFQPILSSFAGSSQMSALHFLHALFFLLQIAFPLLTYRWFSLPFFSVFCL